MAIREYGESLLANVRARNDQRSRDQRKREKKAGRNEFIGKAVAYLGNEALGMARNSIERKTNDYINSTGAFDTKIKLNKAGNVIEKAMAHQTNYTNQDITDQNYFLRLTVDDIVARTQLENANYFKPGTEEEAKSVLMKRPGVISFAKQRAEDNRFIINQGSLYTKGKQNLSVDTLLKRETGTANFLTYGWRKLTGGLPSDPEIINEKLNSLTQVVAADSILAREIERVQNRSNKLKDQKTTDLANSIIGRFSVLEEKEFKNLLVKGEDITDISVTFTNLGKNGHAKTTTTSVNTGLKDASGEPIIKKRSATQIVEAQETAEQLANVFAKDVTSMQNIDKTATPKGSNNATHVAWRVEKERIKNLNLPKLEEQQLYIESAFLKEWAPVGGISADTSGLDLGIAKEVLERNLIIIKDIRTASSYLTDAESGTLTTTKAGQTQKEFIKELGLVLQGLQKDQQDNIATAVSLSSAERVNPQSGPLVAARKKRAEQNALVKKIVTSGVATPTEITHDGIKYPITTDPITKKRSISINGSKFFIGAGT